MRHKENEKLIPIVQKAHKVTNGTYGTRRIAEEIESHGIPCGRHRARTLMNLAGVSVKPHKKFKATTDSRHDLPVSPNLLNRQFGVAEPDRVWVSDITYVWTREGWL